MGAYVSSENCAAKYGTTVNCTVDLSKDNTTARYLGDIGLGEFPGDPDIAGAGACFPLPLVLHMANRRQVLGAFICVTGVSLLLSIASSAWWSAKNIFGVVNRLTRE